MVLIFPTWIAPTLAARAVTAQLCLPAAKKPAQPLALQFLLATAGLPGSFFSLLPTERIDQSAPKRSSSSSSHLQLNHSNSK
jgi:hypothetical protein